ncbi:MAG: cytochrome c3 family protein [Desulfobacterota bacterium]|nr:cytochrome c3 family protein [Thermodesulfobacteriota bacterium]
MRARTKVALKWCMFSLCGLGMMPALCTAADHSFLSSYEGAKTCRQCHEEAVEEITHAIHYRLLGQVQGIYDYFTFNKPITGEHGKGNRYCGLPGGVVGANWAEEWTSAIDPTHKKYAGCGICHVSSGPDALPVTPQGAPIEPTDAAKDQIDCLLCHAKTYDGGGQNGSRIVLTDSATGVKYWSTGTLADARTVGGKVTTDACKRCHINSGGKVFSPEGSLERGYKYGNDFVAEPYELTYDTGLGSEETATIDSDVHAAAGLRCAECHFIGEHKVRYGRHNVSWARDIVPDTFDCADCHVRPDRTAHQNSQNAYKSILDQHTDFLACQTCHIRHVGGLVKRDLRYPVLPEGGYFYDFKDEVHYGITPEYRWFNGTSGSLEAVFEGPCPIGPRGSKKGHRSGDGSKITPFKRYEAFVWFDMLVMQPVPYILKYFFVDGDLETAANRGMEQSGWLPPGTRYDFATRKNLGIVFSFPMVCSLKVDHGVQTGEKALGYATPENRQGCNYCHSPDSTFWRYLGYTKSELQKLQKPR